MNKKLWLLLISYSLIQLAGGMIGPIYALFVEKIGGDLLDASLAYTTYSIATGLAMMVFGALEDKSKDKKILMVLGFALVGAAYFYYMFVTDMWGLLLAQVAIGVGNAMYTPAHDMLYAKHMDLKHAGRQWGTWEAMYNFAIASGAFLGGLIAVEWGFITLFGVMGLVCASTAIYLLHLPRKYL
jgi:predicted MFS family arabinose efflux permease